MIKTLEARTLQYGGDWGVNHAKRLMTLVKRIGEGLAYDRDIIGIAAFMHDWGGYNPWKQEGVDHALRSVEIIPGVLAELGAEGRAAARTVECAKLHHSCGADAPIEAILLHDADAIDFIGVTGILRNFSMQSRNLRGGFEKAISRMEYARGHLILDASRAIAEPLFPRMERLLGEFEQETGGLF